MAVQFCSRPGAVLAGIYKNRRGVLTARDVRWHFGSDAELYFLQSCKKCCISSGFRSVLGFRYFIPGEMRRLKNMAKHGGSQRGAFA